MPKELEENILFSETFLSLREAKDAGPTTLKIEATNTGSCTFYWYAKGKLIEEVGFCINAFFSILMDIPIWFAKIGEAHSYQGCDTTISLICVHDPDHPEIALGVVKEDAETLSSVVVLDRGTVVSFLDKIGHAFAKLEDVEGCASEEEESADENNVEELDEPEIKDPFSGMDLSRVH